MNTTSRNIKPWLFVIGAFALLIAAWTSLIWIAAKHTPECIEVQTGR